MRRLGWVLVVVLGSAVAGCGGDDGGAIAVDAVEQEFEAAPCKWLTRCKGFSDEATCRSLTFLSPARQVAGAKAGRARYDAAQAGKCVAEIESLDCAAASFINVLTGVTCRDVFVGQVAQGGACAVSDDCAGDATCGNRMAGCDPEEACCLGSCGPPQPAIALGAACGFGARCVDGAYCKIMGTSGVCTAPSTMAGAICDSDSACVAPLRCLASACTLPVPSGGTCDPDVRGACALVYEVCDVATRTCKLAPTVGQPCTEQCLGQASCVSGLCVARQQVGQPCTTVDCAGDLDCNEGVCQMPGQPVVCP